MLKFDSNTGELEAEGSRVDLLTDLHFIIMDLISSMCSDTEETRLVLTGFARCVAEAAQSDEVIEMFREARDNHQVICIDMDAIKHIMEGADKDETT